MEKIMVGNYRQTAMFAPAIPDSDCHLTHTPQKFLE